MDKVMSGQIWPEEEIVTGVKWIITLGERKIVGFVDGTESNLHFRVWRPKGATQDDIDNAIQLFTEYCKEQGIAKGSVTWSPLALKSLPKFLCVTDGQRGVFAPIAIDAKNYWPENNGELEAPEIVVAFWKDYYSLTT